MGRPTRLLAAAGALAAAAAVLATPATAAADPVCTSALQDAATWGVSCTGLPPDSLYAAAIRCNSGTWAHGPVVTEGWWSFAVCTGPKDFVLRGTGKVLHY